MTCRHKVDKSRMQPGYIGDGVWLVRINASCAVCGADLYASEIGPEPMGPRPPAGDRVIEVEPCPNGCLPLNEDGSPKAKRRKGTKR